jgi:membrane protease YdiL (CAAX protease family)
MSTITSATTHQSVDRKGIVSFLLITFSLTCLIEGILALNGFRWEGIPPILGQYVIAGVMWVPALATVITIKLITREGFGITNLRLGPFKPYLFSALIIPLAFAVTYGMTWLLGLGQPDWNLNALSELMASSGADVSTMPPASTLLIILFTSSIILGPTINGIFGFGEELGWRGYLLPKLMPLGKVRAYLILGVIWGLWHAPLVLLGFNYPGYPLLGVVWMCALTTALGIFLNEMTLRYKSSILAGSIHGAFNGQGYGIWRQLFPAVNPLLGGMTGIIGILVFAGLGLWVAHWNDSREG